MPTSLPCHSIDWDRIDDELLLCCCRLWNIVWPKDPTPADRLQRLRRMPELRGLADHQVHWREADGQLLAVARTFRREVAIGDRSRRILALASVCTDPAHRGAGHGVAIVRHAWTNLTGPTDCSLFQSSVPAFYERLGSQRIGNPVTTSVPDTRVFWDPHVLIHPAQPDWDETATIDLQGDGW